MQFWQPFWEVFDRYPKMLPSVTEIDWKDKNFSGKFLFLKGSPRRLNCSFDNPVENCSRRNRNFFARALKLTKKDFRRKPFRDLFQWTVRMHFWKTWRCFSARKQIFFVWKSESDNQNSTTFLQKMFNAENASGHEESSFDNPVDKHLTKSRRFFAQCLKKMGEKLKEATSSQNSLIARWNADLTTQSKNFRTEVKTFCSMSEQEKVTFSSESFSACSYVHLESSFGKKRKIFDHSLKLTKKFQRIFSPGRVPIDM